MESNGLFYDYLIDLKHKIYVKASEYPHELNIKTVIDATDTFSQRKLWLVLQVFRAKKIDNENLKCISSEISQQIIM